MFETMTLSSQQRIVTPRKTLPTNTTKIGDQQVIFAEYFYSSKPDLMAIISRTSDYNYHETPTCLIQI